MSKVIERGLKAGLARKLLHSKNSADPDDPLQYDPGITEQPTMVKQGDCDATLGMGAETKRRITNIAMDNAAYNKDFGEPKVAQREVEEDSRVKLKVELQ